MEDITLDSLLQSDRWLGDLFGFPVYRVADSIEPSGRQAGWLSKAVGTGDAFVFVRVPAHALSRVHPLCCEGFRVVDLTLRYSREPEPSAPLEPPRGIRVRRANPEDYDRILSIATSVFRYSRFHLDPVIPRSLANRIKGAWMESYRRGTRGIGCLVATDSDRVVGFLAMLEVHRQRVVRVIDLIGVDPAVQGRGVGRALVESFLHEASNNAKELEVGTQAANVPSVRLYERCGFRLAGSDYVLHAHIRNGELV